MSEIIYGYCRVSTVKQKIERQIENIKREYPEAIIVQDQYTGTTSNRPNWNKLYKQVIDRADKGDKITIVFDEVSRMSRNVDDGMTLYQQMFDKGIELVFIKEPHINTSVYRNKLNEQIKKQNHADNNAAEKLIDTIIVALHEYTIDLAREQVEIAFKTAQQEVEYLHKRTSEGVRLAQLQGKQVGRLKGVKVETKKAKEKKRDILKLSRDFWGTNTDSEVMAITGLARNTYYKYKRELRDEM
jgi:DNA invertase Pin-like site-specific DNA recombinase